MSFWCCAVPSVRVLMCAWLASAYAQLEAQSARHGQAADSSLRVEAISLLQDKDSTLYIDTLLVRSVMHALRAARTRIPRATDVGTVADESYLYIFLADSVRNSIRTRSKVVSAGADSDYWEAPVRETGIGAIDSLNRIYGGLPVIRNAGRYITSLLVYFAKPVNVSVVRRPYMQVPQVMFATREMYFSGGFTGWTYLVTRGRYLHLLFVRGVDELPGNCGDVCRVYDFSYVTFDRQNERMWVESQRTSSQVDSELVAVESRNGPHLALYDSLNRVLAGMRDTRWWRRLNAIEVLSVLLDTTAANSAAGRERDSVRFDRLRREAVSRSRESYEALIVRLTDADPDVAETALGHLQRVSGQHYGAGQAGLRAWRKWAAVIRQSGRRDQVPTPRKIQSPSSRVGPGTFSDDSSWAFP